MSDTVQSALEKRKNQQQAESQARIDAYKKEQESVTAALKAREQRIASSIDTVASNINSRLSAIVNSYNDSISIKPSFGSKVADTYKSQRETRLGVSDLLMEVEAYRKYFGDEATDSVVSLLKEIQKGQDSVLEQVQFMSQFDREEDYQYALRANGYQQKYQDKSYAQIQDILDNMEDGEEKSWLSQYAPSTMTGGDYDTEIGKLNTQINPLEETLAEMTARRDELQRLNAGYARSSTIPKARKDAVAKELKQLNAAIEEAEGQLESLKGQRWTFEKERDYLTLDQNEDFAEKSKAAHDEATAGFGIGFGTGWWGKGDPVYDYINDLDETRQNHMTDMDGRSPYYIYDQMNGEEIATYNYLYNTDGEDAAKEYLDYLEYTLNQRVAGVVKENAAMFADKAPFLASALSVPTNLMSGIGAIDVAGQNVVKGLKESFTGEYAGPVDYNRGAMAPTMFTTTVRGTVAQNITDSTGTIQLNPEEHPILSQILNGKSLGDVYQLGMSMADSATVALLSPYVGTAGTYLLGGSAASQGILDAVEKGATDEQALKMGILNGAFEVLFEKYELENLLGADTNMLKALVNQALTEGFGEGATSIANTAADILVMAENSDYMRGVAAYMEQGLSQNEAIKQALLDAAIQIGWDVVGGMAMGSIMGAAASPIQNVVYMNTQNAQAKQIYGADPGALVAEALEIDSTDGYAQKMNERLTAGKELSGRQLRRLVQNNEQHLLEQDMSSIQDAAVQRLTELGETGNVEAIGAALAKQAAGKSLSKAEQKAIAGSKYGQRVSNELNTENIRSGAYSSAWAEGLDTQRIHPEEYSRLVEAAQQPQEAAETTGDQVTRQVPKGAATAQAEPVAASEAPVAATEEISATGKESLQVVKESLTAETEQEKPVTLEEASQKYGAQAKAMIHTYQAGQDVAKFDKAYQAAYDMGRSGVKIDYALKSASTSYLADSQKELAYNTGKDAADAKAKAKDAENKAAANGKTGWKKGGVVRGEGVTIADLKKAFNDPRGKAYKSLSTIAKATGVNVVLYKSQTDAEGDFIGEQGAFDPDNPNELRIDINAGLKNISEVGDLERYVLLRTFSHEFTHFIEKWNPIRYNEFRRTVFDALDARAVDGKNAHALIELKMKETGLGYEAASREVVADAMTDILPDSSFVQQLAEKHQTIFQKLLEKLKEFVQNLREYFDSIAGNGDYAANALKDQAGDTVKYMDSIVQMWDQIAVEAVENYQATVATEEVVVSKNENTTTVSKMETVEETETKVEDKPVETEQPVTETDAYGFTITDNVERGSLEISFDGKPAASVINALKANKFRWHGKKKLWYGYADRQTITDALHAAYEAEAKPVETPVEAEPVTQEAATETTKPNEEVKDNGKESEAGTDTPAVHEPVRGSEGPARLLEGVEPEAVHGSDDGRQPVQSGSDQGTADAGRDRRADAAGSVSERGTRDRVGGDLQQLPAVSETETDNNAGDKAEQLHDEVVQQIEQKSTVNPKGSNFVIGDSLNLPSGKKARTRANIEAIKLVKQIAAEGRIATAAEQEILSKYVGWGGLADAFGKPYSNKETRRIEYEVVEGLEEEFEELKSVLTEEEYKSARESTKNAHYTSIEVIKAMYDGLKQLGFTGGRMLEPSSGVGNFVGAMPADMTAQVKSWTMVELDNITGLFAKYLYPNADVRIQGFEEANIPDGYMDVAIGNVPFGKYAITDKHYPKEVTSAIHNYFFAKSLDKVRTGGIVMFITSAYTMNASDSAVRKYIMQRADLLGAIRLPNTAFAGNAGTSVVTDILILKKRAERTEYAGEAFETSNWERIGNTGYYDGAYVNEYFVKHPEMVLGTPKLTRGMHAANELTYDPFTDRGSLGDQIREAMKHVKGKMDYSAGLSAEKANFRQASAKKKQQKLQVKDGMIHAKDENGNLTEVAVDKDTAARITGMVAIRDAHVALCDALQQGVNKKESNALRKNLNKAYDSFVEKYGYLNSPKNKKAINAFADRYAILSLENYRTEGRKVIAEKSDIFTKDTIAANRTASSAENVEEGLTISLNTVGVVDVAMIARLTGQKTDSVTRQLIDQRLVFKDRDGNLIPAAQYLSGNVRAKLREMEGLTGIDKDYQNNVEALREVVPPTVAHTDIYVNPGANWVPASVYEDFVGYILKRQNYTAYRTGKKDFSVEYVPETNEYKVSINDSYAKMSAQNTQVWGEGGKAFNTIFENMLNGRRTNVYRDNGDGTRVLDKAKTEAVAEKVEKLNEEFRKWLWEDESRRSEMQELYNETYNALVTPKYSGASLTVNGLNSEYTLRDHQKDAVARIINSGGNTLLAHRVGAGKTMEMAAAAMKLKQLGVIKKPMFVVPNNVVAQWGKEFRDYFPAANILVVGDEDMTAAERMTTINRIKNNDYDAVILAYTKFEKIQMTASWRQKFYEEQIDSIMYAINAEKESQGGKGFTVKQLETKRKQLEAKLKKLTDKAKDEDGAMFEDLGVDSLFVDEAHNFKNLEYSTRMSNVSGLGKADGAQRSFDLYTKVRYLQQLNGGRGVVFATATPVMNSMTEMYIMQKYLQPDTLKQLGIEHFDSWAKMFGEVVNALEIAPSGSGYRLKQTFSKFKNVKALQQLFRSFTDVLTDVPGLKIPKMKGRKVQIVECEQSEFQKNYMAELAKRAENVKNVDPSEDNMLKITSDGRKISYSQRMIDPSLPYEETGKIYKCCENVYAVYQESNKTKGTQMIFCDMATPKGKSSTKTDSDTNTDEFAAVDVESAQLYDDMKRRLVQLGIPAKEIAFIHDAKNDKQKAELSEKMNNGTIRVLIGSTGKMGVGLNAQKKAVAIHHLDAPWRPGDIEQRDGRVFRQKNENEEAYKFVYVTRGSFDSRLWDILERKQKFINQVMNGEDVGNEIEDTGEVTLSAAEVKAVASDNPLIIEQVGLEKEISKLQSLQQAHRAGVSRAQEKMAADRRNIALLERLIASGQADISNRKDTYSRDEVFSIRIGNQTFTDKKDAGTALVAAAQAKAKEGDYTDIGKFAGFTLRVVKTQEGVKGMLSGAGNYEFKTYPLNPSYGINHLISVVQGIDERLAYWNKNLSESKSDLETQKQLAAEPFAQAEKLKQKRIRYNEVMDILNPPKEQQNLDTDGGDTVQYQKRKHFYKNISQQEYRQIQEDRMEKYGDHFEEMPGIDYTHAHDLLYVFENFDETHFGVLERIDPAKNKAKADIYVEAFNNEPVQDYQDLSGRVARLRNFQKLRSVYRSNAGNGRAGTGNAGLDTGSGGTTNGTGMPGTSSGNQAQHQQRTHALTDREVLTLAASQVKVSDLSDAEKSALDVFQQRLAKLEELQEERIQQGRLYKEQQFGAKVDREQAAKTLNRMRTLDSQIQKASAEVLSVEEKTVLKRVLQKARKVVEQQQWTKDQETLKRWRDRRNNSDAIKKYRDRLRGDVDELTNWVLHPDNKTTVKHIPDALKNTVIPFLRSINFESKRSLGGGNPTVADKAMMEQARRLAKVMENTTDVDEMYANYTDLPPDFMTNLRSFMDTAQEIIDNNSGEFVINQMTAEELEKLSKVVRTLKKYIMQMNRFHVNAMFKHVYDAGNNSIDFMAEMKPAENTGLVSQFLLWQQMRPAYAFERFGEGGMAVYDGLRRGQAKLAFNTKKITEFSEKAYTAAEVNAWENEVKTIQINPGTVVKMRVSQIMSLYELNKREQAKGHILGEGIRVATFKNGRQKVSDVGHRLTPGELNAILRELTPRQIEVADNLQQFMQKQGGEWGNYVTVARFGEKQFGEENYFPINSDGRHLSVDAEENPKAASLYALLNMGFTKQTQEKAKNRIIVYSIFDVFANHMASMAQYNAFALPVVDALKWFNYQRVFVDEDGTKTILGSVREQMDRAYGVPEESRPGSGRQGYAQNFVINIIKAFNGTEAQGVPTDAIGVEAVHRYNVAQVAYNLRVVAQQPLAITRAAMVIDYGSIIKGMKLSPATIKKNIAEMQRYSGIAAWKALGFYDVNISRGLTEIIKHQTSTIDKINDFGMTGAEWADTLTWAGIWSACKEEVIRKQKITPKNEGFYEAVTKLFEDVIYKTQVVDSVLTKNEYLRSKGLFARLTGSFMSEPTTTASMLINAFDKYQMDIQRGMTKQQAWKKNRAMIVRTAYVYGIGAAVLAAVQAVADAFRDDDDYEKWAEKWLDAFAGNLVDELMPFNKLPLVSDFYELAKELLSVFGVDTYGNPPQSVYMQWYNSLVKGVEILYDKISGENTNYTWYGGAYKLLQAASGVTGLPMAAATREIITAWNNTIGAMAPSLKVKSYRTSQEDNSAALLEALIEGNQKEVDRISAKFADESEKKSALRSAIKNLYVSGDIDKKAARKYLMDYTGMPVADIYWTLKAWDHGQETGGSEDYSKYDNLYEAVETGKNLESVIREYTENGVAEKTLRSQITEHFKPLYVKMSASEREDFKDNLLDAMVASGAFLTDAEESIAEWDFEAEHGMPYDDMVEGYKNGEISEKEMKAVLISRGLTAEKAEERMSGWDFEMEYGFSYSERDKAYKEGRISAAELRGIMIDFGDMTETEADNYIRAYDWQKRNPQYDLTVSEVLAYTKPIENLGYSVEDYGISPDVYVEYKDKASKCKGEDANGDGRADTNTVKNQKMEVINALPLTSEQKDALYYLNGWAKSKLPNAPWH